MGGASSVGISSAVSGSAKSSQQRSQQYRQQEDEIDDEVAKEIQRVNREELRRQDIERLHRLRSDGSSYSRTGRTDRDGNSISRLATNHLRTNLNKNQEREFNSSSVARIRDVSFDLFDESNSGERQARSIQKQAMAIHNPAGPTHKGGETTFRQLVPIIEHDLQTPTTPGAGKFSNFMDGGNTPTVPGAEESSSSVEQTKQVQASSLATAPAPVVKKKKPGLSIQVNSEKDYSNIPSDMRLFMSTQTNLITQNVSEKSSRRRPMNINTSGPGPINAVVPAGPPPSSVNPGGLGLNLGLEMDPTSKRIAAYGGGENYSSQLQAQAKKQESSDTTVRVGGFKIRESGMSLADENSRRVTSGGRGGGTSSAMFVSLGGSFNFVEIAALGAGASGTVVEALHIPTLTIVALKMLPCYNQAKRQSIESELAVLYKNMSNLRLIDGSLEKETDRGEKKQSPYCLAMYDAFTNPKTGLINLVIEYMDGGSLADLVKCGGCSDEDVLSDISMQVLEGLKYLHENKQLHRDIKPGNILLSCRGDVKIADFGISKAVDGTAPQNSFVGTVTYMSPERIVGETYGYPGDVWSFGVTIFTVAEGQFPFDSAESGYWGMIAAVCDEPSPVPPSPKYSDEFIDFIGSCLDKNPATRGTAAQLLKHPFIKPRILTSDFNEGVDVAATYQSSDLEASTSQVPSSPKVESALSKITHNRVGGKGDGGSFMGDISSKDTPVRAGSNSFNDVDPVKVDHLERILDSLLDIVVSAIHASELMGMPGGGASGDESGGQTTPGHIANCMSEDNSFINNSITRNSVSLRAKSMDIDTVATLHNAARTLQITASGSGDERSQSTHIRASASASPTPVKDSLTKPLETQFGERDGLESPSGELLMWKGQKSSSESPKVNPVKGAKQGKNLMKRLLKVAGFTEHSDLLQWKHLANQLYLPYPLVLSMARIKLEDALLELEGSERNAL